jgi:hypothetical protein
LRMKRGGNCCKKAFLFLNLKKLRNNFEFQPTFYWDIMTLQSQYSPVKWRFTVLHSRGWSRGLCPRPPNKGVKTVFLHFEGLYALQCHKSFYVTAVLIGSCLTWEKVSPHN